MYKASLNLFRVWQGHGEHAMPLQASMMWWWWPRPEHQYLSAYFSSGTGRCKNKQTHKQTVSGLWPHGGFKTHFTSTYYSHNSSWRERSWSSLEMIIGSSFEIQLHGMLTNSAKSTPGLIKWVQLRIPEGYWDSSTRKENVKRVEVLSGFLHNFVLDG